MPHKPIAIVAAMPVELAPLLGKTRSQQVDGVDLFDLPDAVVAVGGIGEKSRSSRGGNGDRARAAEVAGLGGNCRRDLAAAEGGRRRLDSRSGGCCQRRALSRRSGGEWVLATSQDVSDAAEKQELLTKYGADVVDMEAAAVAQVAQERGLEFAAVKAISDDADVCYAAAEPLHRLNGKFDTRRFLVYVALQPRWWGTLGKIKKNSEIASANLCQAVEHLIEDSDSIVDRMASDR